jgi:hypothetical protein
VALALSRGESTVPVSYVELDEDDERLVLATLDPLATLEGVDEPALRGLLASLDQDLDDALGKLMDDLPAHCSL